MSINNYNNFKELNFETNEKLTKIVRANKINNGIQINYLVIRLKN